MINGTMGARLVDAVISSPVIVSFKMRDIGGSYRIDISSYDIGLDLDSILPFRASWHSVTGSEYEQYIAYVYGYPSLIEQATYRLQLLTPYLYPSFDASVSDVEIVDGKYRLYLPINPYQPHRSVSQPVVRLPSELSSHIVTYSHPSDSQGLDVLLQPDSTYLYQEAINLGADAAVLARISRSRRVLQTIPANVIDLYNQIYDSRLFFSLGQATGDIAPLLTLPNIVEIDRYQIRFANSKKRLIRQLGYLAQASAFGFFRLVRLTKLAVVDGKLHMWMPL